MLFEDFFHSPPFSRLGLGSLINELIHFFLPELEADQIADIMEEVLTTSEEQPLQVDAAELAAVLGGDAVIFEERQEDKTGSRTSGRTAMEQEIKEQAAHLRRSARSAFQAAAAPDKPVATAENAAAGIHSNAGVQYWTGKGGARWTAKDSLKIYNTTAACIWHQLYNMFDSFIEFVSHR